jgi:hypothetical protein
MTMAKYYLINAIMLIDLLLLLVVIALIVAGHGQAYPDWCADYQCRWR